jgi:hypothetical protein
LEAKVKVRVALKDRIIISEKTGLSKSNWIYPRRDRMKDLKGFKLEGS